MNIAKQPARDVMASRQERVAYWRIRGLSTRAVAARMAEEGHVNPRTGKAWDHGTIEKDALAALAVWQESARQSTQEWVQAQLARYEALIAEAWAAGDYGSVLRALKQQADLLGLNAPKKMDLEVLIREMAAQAGVDPDEAVRESNIVYLEKRRAGVG